MKNKIRVLVTSIGSTGGQCYIKSLDPELFDVFGVDAEKNNSFRDKVIDFREVPLADHESYIVELLKICEQFCINLLIPVMEPELMQISKNRKQFEDKKIKLLLSNHNSLVEFTSKSKTLDKFKRLGLNTPKVYNKESIEFPIVAKPDRGTGSKNIWIIENLETWNKFKSENTIDDFHLQEFISGEEYSIDFFADCDAELISMVSRKRLEIRNGLCHKSSTVKELELDQLRENGMFNFKLKGPFNLQGIKCEKTGEMKFFELNPRIGGTYILSVQAGLDLNQYVFDFYFAKKSIRSFTFKNLLMVRYLEESYFEN